MTVVRYYPLFVEPKRSNNVKRTTNNYRPDVKTKETDTAYLLSVATPGVPKDVLKIEVKDQKLIIGSKNEEGKENSGKYNFERAFNIPAKVDANAITAEYKDGLLKVTLPKVDNRRVIEVS